MIITNKFYQLLYPIVVEFVKNIIQKQNRFVTNLSVIKIKLRQFNRNDKRLLLSLRRKLLYRMIVNEKYQVVFMNSDISVSAESIMNQTIFQEFFILSFF